MDTEDTVILPFELRAAFSHSLCLMTSIEVSDPGTVSAPTPAPVAAGSADPSPAVRPIRPRRFDVAEETAELLEYLDEHGYAVVASVATPDEVEHAKGLLWQFLEGVCGARRDDVATWGEHHAWPGSSATGIIDGAGVGQSPFM